MRVLLITLLALSAWRRLPAQEPIDSLFGDTIGTVALPPVVVTALRTPFELRRVPYAVSVRTSEEIRGGKPGMAIDEALAGVPGVQVDNRFNYALGERIAIRGFGARTQFGVRGVKVLIDGIPATMPDGQTTLNHVDLGILGRAEVLRGPASAAYGNAAGGVILLETAPPADAPFREELRAVAGSHGLLRTQTTTSGRLGGGSYVVHLSRLAWDGYRDFNDAESLQGSLRLARDGERGSFALVAHAVDYDARNPGSLSAALLEQDRDQAFANNVRQRTGEDGRHGQLGATWSHGAGPGELRVAAHALVRDLDNPIPPRIIDLERTALGARAAYAVALGRSARAPQLIAGAEVERQRDDRVNFVNEQGERGALVLDQLERVRSAGGFAQVALSIGGALSALAGVRYDHFRFEAEDRLISPTNPDDSGERTMQAWSPSLGLTIAVAPAVTVFANVATSFETPTTTELANDADRAGGFNPSLDPQRSRSVELGARGSAGARASWELSLYDARVRDALIPFEVAGVPGRQFFRNAGSTIHRGAELGVAFFLHPAVETRASYAWTDVEFDEYQTPSGTFDGNDVPGVAPHQAQLALSVRPWRRWFVDGVVRYAAPIPVDDANQAESPAYTLVDLRAGVRPRPAAPVSIAPFAGVSNLFDREYNTSVVINAFGGRYFEPGPGRTVYVGLDLGFGPAR